MDTDVVVRDMKLMKLVFASLAIVMLLGACGSPQVKDPDYDGLRDRSDEEFRDLERSTGGH